MNHKDKAEQLRKYALRRNDRELAAAASAVALRAHWQIGQISKDLDKLERARTDLHTTSGTQTKQAQLKAAGISVMSANRAEQLTRIISEAEIERLCQAVVAMRAKASAEARKDLATFIKAEAPEVSNRAIAKALGVSHTQIDRDLGTNVPSGRKNSNENSGGDQAPGTNVPLGLSGGQAALRPVRLGPAVGFPTFCRISHPVTSAIWRVDGVSSCCW